MQNLVREKARAQSEAQQAKRRADLQLIQERKVSDDYMRQMPRRWQTGDVYAPKDLHPHQLAKWKRRGPPSVDVVDLLNVNPLDMYRVCRPLRKYMMGWLLTGNKMKGDTVLVSP